NREKIVIYGDYDVDGTVAIVILKTAIELCGGAAGFHVPHRIRDGYGMKDEVIEEAAAAGVRLIISVDTGIRAFAAAETARRVGEHRIFTRLGLEELRRPVYTGLKALLKVAALDGGKFLDAGHIGFRLGPRLNAAGRMDVAQDVIELFTTRDANRAGEIAEKL